MISHLLLHYCRDLLGRISSLEAPARDAAMIQMLHQLHYLEAMDKDIANFLSAAKFVPVASGLLCAPEELYDPRHVYNLLICCLLSLMAISYHSWNLCIAYLIWKNWNV